MTTLPIRSLILVSVLPPSESPWKLIGLSRSAFSASADGTGQTNAHSAAQSGRTVRAKYDGKAVRDITLLGRLRLHLSADVRLELEGLGFVVEFHSCGIDYPTRVRDRHRLVGLDLILLRQDMKVFA